LAGVQRVTHDAAQEDHAVGLPCRPGQGTPNVLQYLNGHLQSYRHKNTLLRMKQLNAFCLMRVSRLALLNRSIEKIHFPVIPWFAPLITGKYTFATSAFTSQTLVSQV
jgi:hypothetical protein